MVARFLKVMKLPVEHIWRLDQLLVLLLGDFSCWCISVRFFMRGKGGIGKY